PAVRSEFRFLPVESGQKHRYFLLSLPRRCRRVSFHPYSSYSRAHLKKRDRCWWLCYGESGRFRIPSSFLFLSSRGKPRGKPREKQQEMNWELRELSLPWVPLSL